VRSLDDRLAASRTELLGEIEQPGLDRITGRAARLRRRRRTARATAAAGLVLVAVLAVLRPWSGHLSAPPAPPAATPNPSSTNYMVFTDLGVTLNGLNVDLAVADIPGALRDVEFTGPDHGWLLTADCTEGGWGCRLILGETADGGVTWHTRALPDRASSLATVPDLIALDDHTLLLDPTDDGTATISADGGATWRPATAAPGATVAKVDPGDRLVLNARTAEVEVFSGRYAARGKLANQPAMTVRWVAATASADGGWWVGGDVDGHPAVAVTRDRGATWQRTDLSGPSSAWAQVSTLGAHAYAVVMSQDEARTVLHAIYHSPTTGAAFAQTWRGGGDPVTIAGELVPLLDGRLLLADAGGIWYVSETDGATFQRSNDMPRFGRLVRTPGGYVALDVVATGYAAYSADGSTWRKLQAHGCGSHCTGG
jgi:hypothetical protein